MKPLGFELQTCSFETMEPYRFDHTPHVCCKLLVYTSIYLTKIVHLTRWGKLLTAHTRYAVQPEHGTAGPVFEIKLKFACCLAPPSPTAHVHAPVRLHVVLRGHKCVIID